jgi:hypothetical protein
MSENRVLRKTFGPKRREDRGDWRRLLNEEVHDLHSSPNIIRVIKSNGIGRACSICGERRGLYRVLVGKQEEKRLL